MPSEWTFEMLRYAFSYNVDSSTKATSHVVDCLKREVGGGDEASNFESLVLTSTIDSILNSNFDETVRLSALIFLEEHLPALLPLVPSPQVADSTSVDSIDSILYTKVLLELQKLLKYQPIDPTRCMTHTLKSQVLVTYTTILIDWDCFHKQREVFAEFVRFLVKIIKNVNSGSDRIVRAYACECLRELEIWYPGLLYPLLGHDWDARTTQALPGSGMSRSSASISNSQSHNVGGEDLAVNFIPAPEQYTLFYMVSNEALHIGECYSRLFFTTFRHYTEDIARRAVEEANNKKHVRDGTTSEATGSLYSNRFDTSPGFGPISDASDSRSVISNRSISPSVGTTFYDLTIHNSVREFSDISYDLPEDSSPPRLPNKFVKTLNKSLSLVLDMMSGYSSWTKIFFAERLALFVRLLAIQLSAILHHFGPLLYASRPSLIHGFLIATYHHTGDIDELTAQAILERLFAIAQDNAIDSCFRLLGINWLKSLSESPCIMISSQMQSRVQELYPRWHDPLELKEMKLQALTYYYLKETSKLPRDFLCIIDTLSEFKYCSRPVGAHAVVFRFLLRTLNRFSKQLNYLNLPGKICDLLKIHPRLLPSALAVVRKVESKAVRYTLLCSMGEFVSSLEPPSRTEYYFALLVILSQKSWIDPKYVLRAIERLVLSPRDSTDKANNSSSSWQCGMRILVICKQLMIYHPQAGIYGPLMRIFQFMSLNDSCVDVRDRANLYLRLFTHVGTVALGDLLQETENDEKSFNLVDRVARLNLNPRLRLNKKLVGAPVPIFEFYPSLNERVEIGILDGNWAVFVPSIFSCEDEIVDTFSICDEPPRSDYVSYPSSACASSVRNTPALVGWQRKWKDFALDQIYQAVNYHHVCKEAVIDKYFYILEHKNEATYIRLPFILCYNKSNYTNCDLLPTKVFATEISFSVDSDSFEEISPIRIPFICENVDANSRKIVFPHGYKLLVKLLPKSIPIHLTNFEVSVRFNDDKGHTYFGKLPSFKISFEDLFLPVKLPRELWPSLFEVMWADGERTNAKNVFSVKVVEVERSFMQMQIDNYLGPFTTSVPQVTEEDFDFEQEEMFCRESDCCLSDDSSSTNSQRGAAYTNLESKYVIIFISHRFHLLLRFTMSPHACVIRILTDQYSILSYLDSYLTRLTRTDKI